MNTVIEKSAVLTKLAQYKQNLDERENGVYLLIDYNEDKLKRLEEALIQAESRYMLEYTQETKLARDTLIEQMEDVKDELQQHYRFVATINRRHAREVQLMEEEKEVLIFNINAASQLANEKAELLVEAIEEIKVIYQTFMTAYGESYDEVNEIASLLVQTVGRTVARRIFYKSNRHYVGTVAIALKELTNELHDPTSQRVGVVSGL